MATGRACVAKVEAFGALRVRVLSHSKSLWVLALAVAQEEELQKAEGEVRKVREAMTSLQETHEHERQQQHLQLTRLEDQADEYQRRLQGLEKEEQGRKPQGEEGVEEDGVEVSEAAEEEDEEEEGGEMGAAGVLASPSLWRGRARQRAPGSQHKTKGVRSLWTLVDSATGALESVGTSPLHPTVPRSTHHSRSSVLEDHRSVGSEDQPPSPLRRHTNQDRFLGAAGTSKTPGNRGAGASAGTAPWYQLSGAEGAGVMTRSKKKKLQMSLQGLEEPADAEAGPGENESGQLTTQASGMPRLSPSPSPRCDHRGRGYEPGFRDCGLQCSSASAPFGVL